MSLFFPCVSISENYISVHWLAYKKYSDEQIQQTTYYPNRARDLINTIRQQKSIQKKHSHDKPATQPQKIPVSIQKLSPVPARLTPQQARKETPEQKLQKNVRTNFGTQIAYFVEQEVPEYQELSAIYEEYDIGDVTRFEKRLRAFHELEIGNVQYLKKSYTLSKTAIDFLHETGNETLYATCYGTQLQQVIHAECIDIIEQTVALAYTSPLYIHKDAIIECTDAACEYNQAGFIDKATIVTDFCWALLDYGKAVLEGAVKGVGNAVIDMAHHPVQTMLCAVAGEYVLAYQLSKVIYHVAEIGITTLINQDQGIKQWHEYIAPVTGLIDAISNKQITVRNAIQGATEFAVGWKAQSKLLGGLNKLYTRAKTQATTYAEKYSSSLPEQYLATPEGFLLNAAHELDHPKVLKESLLLKMSNEQKIKRQHKNLQGVKNTEIQDSWLRSISVRITSKQAKELAEKLGFKKINYYSHGQPIFQKGNRFITIDIDSHSGGIWKMADSIENLCSKKTRLGTYDQFLNRIGD